MNRALRLILLAILASAPALAQATNTTWLASLMKQMATIPARQAEFVEEKHIAALNQPLISRGRLIYRRPSYFAKITTAPQPETLIVNGDQLSLGTGNAAPRILRLASHPAIAALVEGIRAALAGDLPTLRRFYRILAEGDPTAWRLVLTPTAPSLARFLRSVTLEGSNTVVRGIKIRAANGDEQGMTITPVR